METLRNSVKLALSATTPAAHLTDQLRRANQECVRLGREVESAHICAANIQAWLDEHTPLLAEAEQASMDTLIEQFVSSASGPPPPDTAQEMRADFARISAAHRQLRDFMRPAKERKAMLAQAVALEARAALLDDIVAQREDRKATLMVPLLALEGKVELSDTDSTTEKLRTARGELLVAAGELRERVRDLDSRAAMGAPHAPEYQPGLLDQFSDRFRALFDVISDQPRGQGQ